MEHPVSVTTFERGERQGERILSKQREARAGFTAAGLVGGISVLAMAAFVALTWAAGFVLHTPIFVGSWAVVTGLAGGLAFRHARDRAARYRVGARMDADAFSNLELDLVRPGVPGVGYELLITAGMTGFLDEGGARQPIEGLTGDRRVMAIPLARGTSARVDLGNTTFVVRALDAEVPAALDAVPAPLLGLPGLGVRRFAMSALGGAPIAALLSLLAATDAAVPLSDADLLSAIPVHATALQIERFLQRQAQTQADALHACFDRLPLFCHKPGYVAVGLHLAATGEVKRSWVSRTTYGSQCPVTSCMERVVGTWYFEPVREPTTVIIPVQVLQTGKAQTTFVPIKLADSY